MGLNIKIAAERLIKIANELEREAADNTFFVCDGCNHTASLADINKKRKVASAAHNVKRTANVSVNDSVTCLACGGKMSYVPTDVSQKYYVEAEDTEDTGADIFEPVDERDTEKTEDTSDTNEQDNAEPPIVDETAPETSENDMPPAVGGAIPDIEKTPEGDTQGIVDYDGNPEKADKSDDTEMNNSEKVPDTAPEDEDTPAPEDEDTPAPEDEDTPVVEETVPENSEEVSTDEKVPVDETEPTDEEITEAELPKKDVPKFEKIPKEAQDAFWRSVAKYSV
jgi:hypothetical protein